MLGARGSSPSGGEHRSGQCGRYSLPLCSQVAGLKADSLPRQQVAPPGSLRAAPCTVPNPDPPDSLGHPPLSSSFMLRQIRVKAAWTVICTRWVGIGGGGGVSVLVGRGSSLCIFWAQPDALRSPRSWGRLLSVVGAPLGGGLLQLLCPGVVSPCCGCDGDWPVEAAQWICVGERLSCIFYLK